MMKYLKSYILTSILMVGISYIGIHTAQILMFFFGTENVSKYSIYLGLVGGSAGPIGLLLKEKSRKK